MKTGTSGLIMLTFLALGASLVNRRAVPQQGVTPPLAQAAAAGARQDEQSSATPVDGGGNPSSNVNAGTRPCYRDAPRLLRDFFGLPENQVSPDLLKTAGDRGYTLEFLIATLPDPVDAGPGWRFDLLVDCIERALEANDFVQDRFSLPWSCNRTTAKTTPASRSSLQEWEPGVILFRHLNRPHLLMLFLVGESPTSGICKKALTSALNTIGRCAEWDGDVKILGPALSGSRTSLRITLTDWYRQTPVDGSLSPKQRPNLHFTIISGSATNSANKQMLEVEVDGKEDLITFFATVIPDQIALKKFREYLHQVAPVAKVAELRESNTGYAGGTTFQGSTTGNDADPWIILPFPMHISQLRSRYERQQHAVAQPTPTGSDDSDGGPKNLTIPLDEMSQPSDVPPSFVPSLTSGSVDLVLANILSTISKEGVTHVGLFATDDRDKLFLAGQIHKYCPDVRLFTFESDILFNQPEYNADLRGMVVVSTYPLINSNQTWTFPFRSARNEDRRLQFPLQGAEGTYNAVLALLNYRRPVKDSNGAAPLPMYRMLSDDGTLRPGISNELSNASVSGEEIAEVTRLGGVIIGKSRAKESLRVALRKVPDKRDRLISAILPQARLPKQELAPNWPQLMEYGPPLSMPHDKEIVTPSLWFTIVGRNGLWPLTMPVKPVSQAGNDKVGAADQAPEKQYVFPARALVDPKRVMAPVKTGRTALLGLFQIGFVILWLVCLVSCAGCWGGSRSYFRQAFLPVRLSCISNCPLHRGGLYAFWVFIYLSILTALYLALSTPLLLTLLASEFSNAHHFRAYLAVLSVLVIFPVLVTAMIRCLRKVFQSWPRKAPSNEPETTPAKSNIRTNYPLIGAAVAIAAVCALVAVWVGTIAVINNLAKLTSQPGTLAPNTREALLWCYRAMALDSGVSPFVPLVLLAVGLCVCCFFRMARLLIPNDGPATPSARDFVKTEKSNDGSNQEAAGEVAAQRPEAQGQNGATVESKERWSQRVAGAVLRVFILARRNKAHNGGQKTSVVSLFPLAGDGPLGAGIGDLVTEVEEVLYHPFRSLKNGSSSIALLLLFVVPLCFFLFKRIPPFETAYFEPAFIVLTAFLYFALVLAFVDFIRLWVRFKRLLQRLAVHPLVAAFDRVGSGIPRATAQLWPRLPRTEELLTATRELIVLLEHYSDVFDPIWPDASVTHDTIKKDMALELGQAGVGPGTLKGSSGRSTQQYLAVGAQRLALNLKAEDFWMRSLTVESGEPRTNGRKLRPSGNQKTVQKDAEQFAKGMRLAEDIIATQVTVFISKVFVHLRNGLGFMMTVAFVILFGVSSYPFEPKSLLNIFMLTVILTLVLAGLTLLVQAEHDEVLSRISKTAPNRITFDARFISAFLTYGALPVLALLFTLVPGLASTFSWLEPVLRAFK